MAGARRCSRDCAGAPVRRGGKEAGRRRQRRIRRIGGRCGGGSRREGLEIEGRVEGRVGA
jgi:hypothetical protein